MAALMGAAEDRLRAIRKGWCELDKLTAQDPEAALVMFERLVAETTAALKIIWRLRDQQDRLVLVEYYLLRKTVPQIAEEDGVGQDAVFRRKRLALNHLDFILKERSNNE